MFVPILLYHRIEEVPTTADPYRLSVPPWLFEAHLRYLSEHNYYCLSLKELLVMKAQQLPLPKKSVVITFDDGYKDNYSYAYPLLKRYGFTATIFLVVDCIGQMSNWQGATGDMAAPLMSWPEILEMQAEGIEFGSHTHSHAWLPLLDTVAITYEVEDSKRALAAQLGMEVNLFAYPYEALDERTGPLVKQSGYLGACGFSSTIPEDNFSLWRVECNTIDTLARFQVKLSGWPRFWTKLKTRLSIIKSLRKGSKI